MKIAPVALLLVACAANAESEPGALMAAMTCNQSACDYVVAHKGQTVQTKYLSCCVALMLTACPPQPPVNPIPDSGTGGTAATGGAAATGGSKTTGGTTSWSTSAAFSRCVADKKNSPNVKNVSLQTGQSAASLANTMCNDATILEAYR